MMATIRRPATEFEFQEPVYRDDVMDPDVEDLGDAIEEFLDHHPLPEQEAWPIPRDPANPAEAEMTEEDEAQYEQEKRT
ncbi:hypothetical protein AB0395_28820 [Streptosporangium sp. NPDC051023]|uniref:hypothetical protein n=1 Tax=Streptosporangium sp. NPDC051023 TaxID=3155410 RepID=UPI00344C0F45